MQPFVNYNFGGGWRQAVTKTGLSSRAERSDPGAADRAFGRTLASAVYLGLEAAAWAGLYLSLGALPGWRDAMLYSLGAITSYGHAPIFLEDRWRLLGAIEAVNGLILFGLTTAFLYAAIHEVWPLRRD
jgi:hypothetical protein